MPINKRYLAAIAGIALATLFSFSYLNVSVVDVFLSFPNLILFFGNNFLPPNFSGFTNNIPIILHTLLFAIVGTYISAILAFILGILMSVHMNPFPVLRGAVRFFVSFLRNVPLLIWAQFMVFIFGIGAIIGVLALVMASLGFLARSYAESIDEIAGNKLEALRSTGAGYWQILYHGLLPEFLPAWVNWTLFSFEINVRASAILGMVGAGGLGLLIQTNLDLRGFRRAMALITVLIVMVLITEFLVNYIRHLLEKEKLKKGKMSFTIPLMIFFTGLFFGSGYFLNLDFVTFATRLGNAGHVITRFMAFNPQALPEIIRQLMISIALGICGLVIGSTVSLILAFLAADNITFYKPLSKIIKGAVGLIRAIPSLVLILMIVASLGFGYTTAVVGLTLSSAGYLTKAFISSIEEQDFAIIESMKATGASWLQIIIHGILPGVASSFVSWISIRLENNVGDSIALGIVGAGGVGMLVSRAVRTNNFADLTTTVLVIFAAMALLEGFTKVVKNIFR